jgi:hypothetical protein
VNIITLSKDQNINELVQQLFSVPRRSTVRAAQAVQALIDANPHLQGAGTIPAGTPIVIPDVPGLTPRSVDAASVEALQELQTRAREALVYAQSVVQDAARTAEQEARDSLDVLRSRDFQALAREANVDVESLTQTVTQAAKDAQAKSNSELANLTALSRALDEMVKTLGTL